MITWKPIPNYPDYEVSTDGRVRHGKTAIKRRYSPSGYPIVCLKNPTHGLLEVSLAECVAKAHGLPDPGYGHAIWFRDSDKTNCRIENLYWRDYGDGSKYQWASDKAAVARRRAGRASAKLPRKKAIPLTRAPAGA